MNNPQTIICSESLWNSTIPSIYPPPGELNNIGLQFEGVAYDEKNETYYIATSYAGILKWSPVCSSTLFRLSPTGLFATSSIFLYENRLYFYNSYVNYVQRWTIGTSILDRQNIAGSGLNGNKVYQLGSYCAGLIVDQYERYIYISDSRKNRVIRWPINGVEEPIVIAGNENGQSGSSLSELIYPKGIYLDEKSGDLYVADSGNYRIMRYSLRDSERLGKVVAGGNGEGTNPNQLRGPVSIVTDQNGTMYIGDFGRVIRWMKDAQEGQVLIGNDSFLGSVPTINISSTFVSLPVGINFDKENNLYFADQRTRRIVKMHLDNSLCLSMSCTVYTFLEKLLMYTTINFCFLFFRSYE